MLNPTSERRPTLVDGHHPNFLTRHERRIEGWVLAAAEANRAEAIAGLVGQTHTDNVEDPWHTVSLARRAREGGLLPSNGLFLVGEGDRIASPKECRLLAEVGAPRLPRPAAVRTPLSVQVQPLTPEARG